MTERMKQRDALLRLMDVEAILGLDLGKHGAIAHQLRARVVAVEESQLDVGAR